MHPIFIALALVIALSGSVPLKLAAVAQPHIMPFWRSRNFTFSGSIRAFYFTRTNRVQNRNNPNRPAFNLGGRFHGEYRFSGSPWVAGATYFGADPLEYNGFNPGFNSRIDNTLPGFSLSTLAETYLQYRGRSFQAKLGNQALNTPWAPASDSRVKAAYYQGVDAQWMPSPHWTVAVDRILRFEHRTSSSFMRRTLLTDQPAGNPSYPIIDTNGTFMTSLSYKNGMLLALNAYEYYTYDIDTLLYVDGKWFWKPRARLNPFISAQLVRERQTGAAVVGLIDNRTVGVQLGASPRSNIDVAVSWNSAPWRSLTIGGRCASIVPGTYFLPAGGTTACVDNGSGTATVYYGGIASPYSEGYATDPLYTTSITQGMVDRHSPGDAYKAAVTYQTADKRIRVILSDAWYYYNNLGGGNQTRELNADATFYFNHVGSGPYRGLSLRHRYADRTQPTVPDDFKYNRTQLQWDF